MRNSEKIPTQFSAIVDPVSDEFLASTSVYGRCRSLCVRLMFTKKKAACVSFRRRSGRVLPYDDEAGTTTTRRKRSKTTKKRKVIQTQTSPAHRRLEQAPPTSTAHTAEQPRLPPAVFITDATPIASPRDRTPTPLGSLPGAVVDDDEWARPYPGPTQSVAEPQTASRKPVTVERVPVKQSRRAVTPSAVAVTGSQLKHSTTPRDAGQRVDLVQVLPDMNDGSKNVRPG